MEIVDSILFGAGFLERRLERDAPDVVRSFRGQYREMGSTRAVAWHRPARYFDLFARYNHAAISDVELARMAFDCDVIMPRRWLEIDELARFPLERPSEWLRRKRARLAVLLSRDDQHAFDAEWQAVMHVRGYAIEMAAWMFDERLANVRDFSANVYRMHAEYQSKRVLVARGDRRRCLDVLDSMVTPQRFGPRLRTSESWALQDFGGYYRELAGLADDARLPFSKSTPGYGPWARFAFQGFAVAGLKRPGWRLIQENLRPA